VHHDFMVGGDNVYIYAENKNGEKLPLIIENKFVI